MNKVSDKCLKVSVDVKSSDAGLTVPLGVTTMDGDLRYVMMNGGNIEVENGPQIMAYEAGRWITLPHTLILQQRLMILLLQMKMTKYMFRRTSHLI